MINDILNKQPYDNLRGLDSTSMTWKRTHKAKQKIILIAISPDEFFSLVVNRTLMLKRRLSPCYCGVLCYQSPSNSDSNGGFPILAHKYMDDSQNTAGVNVEHFAQHQSAQLISFVSYSIRKQNFPKVFSVTQDPHFWRYVSWH